MNYKNHEITIHIRRIVVEEATLDENGGTDQYFESWAETELSSWYATPDIDRKFRTINGLKKAIDKLEQEVL